MTIAPDIPNPPKDRAEAIEFAVDYTGAEPWGGRTALWDTASIRESGEPGYWIDSDTNGHYAWNVSGDDLEDLGRRLVGLDVRESGRAYCAWVRGIDLAPPRTAADQSDANRDRT